MKYELVPVVSLRALEMVFPFHMSNLKKIILDDGFIRLPLIVERKHNIVLDGSHRHVFLAMEGFKYAPVFFVDYDDPHIRVGSHLMHRHIINEPINISKEEVVRRGLSGDLFPPRTTRHFFPFRKTDEIHVNLSDLDVRSPIDLSSNVFKGSIQDEIIHNKKFIGELEDEMDEVIRYLDEIRQTKKYLSQQIDMMKEVA